MKRKFIHHTVLRVTDIAVKAFMVSLASLAFSGIAFMIFQLVFHTERFNNISFGIYN